MTRYGKLCRPSKQLKKTLIDIKTAEFTNIIFGALLSTFPLSHKKKLKLKLVFEDWENTNYQTKKYEDCRKNHKDHMKFLRGSQIQYQTKV